MTRPRFLFPLALSLPGFLLVAAAGQEAASTVEVFEHEYEVGAVDWFTGEGVEPGGFVFPSVYLNAAGGAFEPGADAEDFATSGHDPQNGWGIQAIHLHLDFEFGTDLKSVVSGFGHQGANHVWEAELEEAKILWQPTESLAIGGGQFLNRFGFQSDLHLHDWFFVNRNLTNSRFLNEGELVTQGGELILGAPKTGQLTFGFGGLRSHSHDHDHDHGGGKDEEDRDDEPAHEEHFELENAAFQGWVATSDYRFHLPIDDSITGSLSLAFGENGSGGGTTVFAAGFRKVWNGHDHGHGDADFCAGAWMWQSEVMAREVEAVAEDGDLVDLDDYGYSNSLHYGLSDLATLSLRHDWVSAVEAAEIPDRNRLSAALTAFVDPARRVRARLQYDRTQDDLVGGEHAAWFEIQLQWGGVGGSHAGHGH